LFPRILLIHWKQYNNRVVELHCFTQSESHAYTYAWSESHAYAYAYAWSESYAYAYAWSESHTYAYAYAWSESHAYAWSESHAYAYAWSESHAYLSGYFGHPFRKQVSLRSSDVVGMRSVREGHDRNAWIRTDNPSISIVALSITSPAYNA
jgi:hypothetical protein